MRAILSRINERMSIIDEEVSITNYKDYSKYLECDLFDVVSVEWNSEQISIFVDDEGMMKENFGRRVMGYPDPLFGNMVITGGVDSNGETLPAPEWLTRETVNQFIGDIEYRTKGF